MTFRTKLWLGTAMMSISLFNFSRAFAWWTGPLSFMLFLGGFFIFSRGCYESGKGHYLVPCELRPGKIYLVLGFAEEMPRLAILDPADHEGHELLVLLDEPFRVGDRVVAQKGKFGTILKLVPGSKVIGDPTGETIGPR